jgi:hypothetical protein
MNHATPILWALDAKQTKDGRFAAENYALSLLRELEELEKRVKEIQTVDRSHDDFEIIQDSLAAIQLVREPLRQYLQVTFSRR